MRKKNRYWMIAGSGALAVAAAVVFWSPSDQPPPEEPTAAQFPETQTGAEETHQQRVAATEPADDKPREHVKPPVPYVDENGVVMRYGDRIRFSHVRDCTETFVQSMQGEWLPTHDCGPTRLAVDHPYGSYTIEQLEYAADEMNDADAAYILAERFAWEQWRDRRDEAHKYYLKAFLLTTDGEIYQHMLSEMGAISGTVRVNGVIDPIALANNYTMARVGEKFGVVERRDVEAYASVAEQLDEVDLEQLEQDAEIIYQTMLAAKEDFR